ncbi:hypothetical protein SprV_0802597000 [Sparganum proliferum]
MVRQLHDDIMTRITDNGAVSEEFAVTNCVKHGCVLAPTLFSLMFPSMLMDAERDDRPGIHLVYGTTGHLLNLRRMHFRSRVSTVIIHILLFSDMHLGIHIAIRNYHPFVDDNTDACYRFRRLVQQRLREMQNAQAACKAMEIQGYADHNEWKNFFSAIYCPPAKRTAPLLSADGNTPLTEKTQIL